MIIRRILLALLLLIFIPLGVKAQILIADPQSIISDILEDITSATEDEIDIEALAEDLLFFVDNPINLNTTTYDELGRLVFLSDFQINSILDYVKANGEMLSVYELQLVFGFDYIDIVKLAPFVTVSKKTDAKVTLPKFRGGKHELFLRGRSAIETSVGYTPPPVSNPNASRYAGNKLGVYTRYSYKTRSGFQVGFVGEKDPGEEFFKGSNPYGFDHYSFHLQVNDIGKIKTVVVGDFNAEFGQGLTLWSSTSFGKSSDPLGVRKRAKGLYRYSSTNENMYLRGGGATVRFGIFEVSAFGSYKKIDANVTDSIVDGLDVFTTLPTSGLHRTQNELRNKKVLGELVSGGNVNISWRNLKAGVTGSFVNLEGYYTPPDQPYKYFEPPLNNRVNFGTDITVSLGNHMFFGEASKTFGHGAGALGGGLFRVHPLLNLSILARAYQKDYSTYYTSALAESSGPSNENGILVGMAFKPIKHWEISGYSDFFTFPWLRFGVNSPSRGHDYSLQALYSPRSHLNFSIRYRLKQKEKNQTIDSAQIRWVVPYTGQALRFHLSYSPSRIIDLKTRIEFSWYEEENLPLEKGLVVYQDFSYRPNTIPLTLTARFAVFETDSWNTRIYAYESDVLYYFSVPAYYSMGTRAYFLAKYTIGRDIDIWFRIAQTFYANQTSIGSGLDKTNGPSRSDVRIQARFKF